MAFSIKILKYKKQDKFENGPFMIRNLLVSLPEWKRILKILTVGIEKLKKNMNGLTLNILRF
jgi:hypothetical protein